MYLLSGAACLSLAILFALTQAILGLDDVAKDGAKALKSMAKGGDSSKDKGPQFNDEKTTADGQPRSDMKQYGPHPLTIGGTSKYNGYFINVVTLSNGDKVASAAKKEDDTDTQWVTVFGKLLRKYVDKKKHSRELQFGAINKRHPQGIAALSFNEKDDIMIAYDHDEDKLRANLIADQFYVCQIKNEQVDNVVAFFNGTEPPSDKGLNCEKADTIWMKDVPKDDKKLFGLF